MTSAFKKLFTDMISAGGDETQLAKDMRKQMLKVFVKETHPYFLISDSYFFVPAYFTQQALNEFKSKFSNVNIMDLKEKVILITNWSLELKKVNSTDVFTSYANLEVRLIVNSFKPQLQEALHPTRYPTNLYRDDEFKTTIQAFRHKQLLAKTAKSTSDMAPLHGGKGNDVGQGIVRHKGEDWHFREGSTKVVTLGSGSKRTGGAASAAKVKGGASGKRATKAAGKKASVGKGAKTVEKVLKYSGKRAATPAKGKQSAKRSATKKALPTPSGKKSKATTDKMTMQTFKQFLKYHDKGGKRSAKSPGKAGKKSNK